MVRRSISVGVSSMAVPQLANRRRCAWACRDAAASTQGMKLSISVVGCQRRGQIRDRFQDRARTACASTRRYAPAVPCRNKSRRHGITDDGDGVASLIPLAARQSPGRPKVAERLRRRRWRLKSAAPGVPNRTCAASSALPLRFDPVRNGSASVAASTARSMSAIRIKSPFARCAAQRDAVRACPAMPEEHGHDILQPAPVKRRIHGRESLDPVGKCETPARKGQVRVLQDREQIDQGKTSSISAREEMTRRSRIKPPSRARYSSIGASKATISASPAKRTRQCRLPA